MIIFKNKPTQIVFGLTIIFFFVWMLSWLFDEENGEQNMSWICRANDENALEIDFEAIDFTTPHMALSSSIGNGLDFTTRILTSRLTENSQCENPLLDYLLSLNHQGEVSN